jgi:RNA-directed DNA polymerase
LKSSGLRQLTFAFADNPRGSSDNQNADESAGRAFLLHQAEVKETTNPDAGADDADRLLEEVALLPNLVRALFKVARNKGASEVDGQSVEEVVEMSPELLPRIRQALIEGTYLPGDIRRVWIPKSGGGERGLGIPNVVDRVV